MEKFSLDCQIPGGLTLSQPESGYRYTSDALVLAAYADLSGAPRVIDAGCGCGIISMILARRYPEIQITGIEIQKELADHARNNVTVNHLSRRIRILNSDLNKIQLNDVHEKAGFLVSNPPYKKRGSGRLNPNRQKAVARHEIMLDIDQLFAAASGLLHDNGKLGIIFPAERLEDIDRAAADHRFSILSVRMIHTRREQPPARAIVHAGRNMKADREILTPVCI